MAEAFVRQRVDRWVMEHTIEEQTENAKESADGKTIDNHRQFRRLYRATVRGFVIGLLVRGGLHSVTALARVAKRQAPGGIWERSLDTVRWACALGCFGGVYVGVDEALRSLVGCNRQVNFFLCILLVPACSLSPVFFPTVRSTCLFAVFEPCSCSFCCNSEGSCRQ
jgi:hypothetical protein